MIHLKIESNSSKNRTFAPERLQVAIINNNNNQTTTTTTTKQQQQQQQVLCCYKLRGQVVTR
jgi:hypothetical protein